MKMPTEKLWYVYIIRTLDEQLYTGITTDIQRRWQEHSSGKGGARYFRAHKPHSVCWLETHPNRSAASIREAAIKKLGKAAKESLIKNFDAIDNFYVLISELTTQ